MKMLSPILSQRVLLPALTLSAALTISEATAKQRAQQNLLFIIIDDLRPELGCFGSDVISPNIDAFAKSGVLFENSYCNIPVSGASRACLMTGTRPTRNTFLSAYSTAALEKPDMISINEHFQNAGYTTIVEGKVFHFAPDHQEGWDRRVENPIIPETYVLAENQRTLKSQMAQSSEKRGPAFECADVEDEAYCDGMAAAKAMVELEALAEGGEPFFYAFGVARPHLPFNAPKKYWDLYDFEDIELPDNFELKEGGNLPGRLFHKSGELYQYTGVKGVDGKLEEEYARTLIHGYKAAVSYVDAQIGKLLDKLEELGLDENTAVILLGDHGWNLGDHGLWCKHTVFDHATNTPVIVRDPASKLKGYVSDEIIEYVDIFPTMCELTGIPIHEQAEGESILPLLNSKKAKHKGYAISRWQNGYKITRQDGLAYIEWWNDQDEVLARALFDHNTDPTEDYNIVNDPKYAEVITELSAELKANRGENFDKYEKRKVNNDPFNLIAH